MKLRLQAKMMLYILLPAIVGMGSIAMASRYLASEAMQDQILADMQILADSKTNELQSQLTALHGAANTLAQDRRVEALAIGLRTNQAPENLISLYSAAQVALESTTTNYSFLKNAGIVDTKGIIAANTVNAALNASLREEPFFSETMKGTALITTMLNRQEKLPAIIVTAPIKSGTNVLGMVYIMVDMPALTESTIAAVKMGSSGRCMLYDQKGVMLLHPSASLVGQDYSSSSPVLEGLAQKNGRTEYVFEGKETYAFFKTLPITDWLVMVSVSKSEMLAPIDTMTRLLSLLALVSILIVGGIIFFFARSIVLNLQGGAAFTQYIAEGNLRIEPEQQALIDATISRNDELGDLSSAIVAMVKSLISTVEEAHRNTTLAEEASKRATEAMEAADQARHEAVGAKHEGMLAAASQLEGVVNIIGSASTELAAQIDESEHGATEQSMRLQESATAMLEMNQTVEEVARNASTAADVSAHTRQDALSGSEVVEKVIHSIANVQKQSIHLKDNMQALGEKAASISQVMSVISDIADQTNLLALNAAIEAARAGEAGRGFAVVADEVRKLAEKTMHSTVDVANVVRSIQESTQINIKQVEATVATIDEANALAMQSGEALSNIVRQVDTTADQVRAIATASEEQSATSEEIARSVSDVNTIAAETARAMQEAARAVADLAHQANQLEHLITEMKNN